MPINKRAFLAQFGRVRHTLAWSGFLDISGLCITCCTFRTCGTGRYHAARKIFTGATTEWRNIQKRYPFR